MFLSSFCFGLYYIIHLSNSFFFLLNSTKSSRICWSCNFNKKLKKKHWVIFYPFLFALFLDFGLFWTKQKKIQFFIGDAVLVIAGETRKKKFISRSESTTPNVYSKLDFIYSIEIELSNNFNNNNNKKERTKGFQWSFGEQNNSFFFFWHRHKYLFYFFLFVFSFSRFQIPTNTNKLIHWQTFR